MKKCIIYVLTFAMVLSLTGCLYKDFVGKLPCDKPGSEWISEDGTITFWVNNSGKAYGRMKTDRGTIDIRLAMGLTADTSIYLLKNNEEVGNSIELWTFVSYRKKDEFTVKVNSTTYYEVGQKIKFYRIDES